MACSTEARVLLLCLFIHACVITKIVLFTWAVPEGFEELQVLLLIIPTGLGLGCGISCARKHGWVNGVIATLGLTWFGLLLGWVVAVESLL